VDERPQNGERVLLRDPKGKTHLVTVGDGVQRLPGLGVIDHEKLANATWGSSVRFGAEDFLLLRPTLIDHLERLDRGAQIITAKDAARIVLECGLHAGSRVAEAGVGSGALTLVLAHAVAPAGRVYAYDVREDHLKLGRRNVTNAGLDGVVEFNLGDIADAAASSLDAFVLDLPEPAAVVPTAARALRHSGIFASYSPQVSQVETTVRALRAANFLDIRTIELLERGWQVGERGSRPETNMLGHTGFLTFARKG
jgi:tRNA (adenine57-N1/adenine58-N1)-methyltransferase catalytic subunit